MENKIIILHWNNIIIGGLSFIENKYIYTKKKENYESAKNNGCPISIVDTEEGLLENIPPIFTEFEINSHREDLIDILNITNDDNRFERLCKRAKKYDLFNQKDFWISLK